jgi:cell division protease FtsH
MTQHSDGPAVTAQADETTQKTIQTPKSLAQESRRLPRPGPTVLLVAALVMLFGLLVAALAYLSPPAKGQRLSVDQLAALAGAGRVQQVTFHDQDAQITGTFKAERQPGAGIDQPASSPLVVDSSAAPGGAGAFRLPYAGNESTTALLLQTLTAGGAKVDIDPQSAKATVRLLTTVLLPLLILANLFGLLFQLARGGGSGLGEIRGFGTLAKRGGAVEPPAARFSDVAGADEAVAELAEVVAYLRDPDRYASLGAAPPKGVLLFGPPGTGKTLIARATAGEAGVPFFSVAGAEFVESLVGVGAARVRDLFARVRAAAPAILFMDELDAAGRRRGSGDASGGSDEREQTLNQLLVEIDGFDVAAGIVVMGATNRPDILDPALLRPGRFDRHVTIDQPDITGRQRILAIHVRGKPIGDDVDLDQVARRTPGFTGADLANVVNEAALLAIREGKQRIGTPELTEAVQRVLSGPQRRGRVLSDEERRRIATHEVGHALVATATGDADAVQRISLVARGRGLGSVQLGADRDAVLLTRSQLESQLAAAASGRAAEELVFGEPSTGSEGDLERATDLARDLVARYGMSERLGRLRFMAKEADLFLGGSARLERLSGLAHQELDKEMRRIVDAAFATATTILQANRGLLDDLVDHLLQAETVEGSDLDAVLRRVAKHAPAPASPARSTSGPPDGRGRTPAEPATSTHRRGWPATAS